MSLNQDLAEQVSTVIAKRRSVRRFLDAPVDKASLRKLVAAGIAAPSGSNWQNQRFLVVDDPDEIRRIGESRFVWPYKGANQSKIREKHPGGIIGGAAALIIVFADSVRNDRRGNGEYHLWENLEIQNCSASIENILILATAMRIGTCWISASDRMNYTRLFSGKSWRGLLSNYEIPEYYKLQGIIILGHPRSVDELGFPKGERMHGATVWQSTNRAPLDSYLIQPRRDAQASCPVRVAFPDRLLIKVLSRCIRFFQKASAWCDRRIHQREVVKYIKPQ